MHLAIPDALEPGDELVMAQTVQSQDRDARSAKQNKTEDAFGSAGSASTVAGGRLRVPHHHRALNVWWGAQTTEDSMSQIKNPAARIRHKRTRQSQLLHKRAELGRMWAQKISHAQPGVGKVMADIALLEIAITDSRPSPATISINELTISGAKKFHDPDTENPVDCPLCQQTATATIAA